MNDRGKGLCISGAHGRNPRGQPFFFAVSSAKPIFKDPDAEPAAP